MKVVDILDYAEQNPDEWFAQVIENAWDEKTLRDFAKSVKSRKQFESIRDAANESYASAQNLE